MKKECKQLQNHNLWLLLQEKVKASIYQQFKKKKETNSIADFGKLNKSETN